MNKKYDISSSLTAHQKEIFEKIVYKIDDIIKTNMMWDNILSLSGAAGTGKTFLTAKIVKHFTQNSKYNITMTAPTHKALYVLRKNLLENGTNTVTAKTIQSFLNIKLFTDYEKGVQKFRPDKNKTNKDVSKTDILIVDESSMISAELYNYIVEAIEHDRVKVVLFIGDPYQLLPINSKENKVFTTRHQYILKDVVRQAEDSYIIQLATKIRDMIKTQEFVGIQSFFMQYAEDKRISFFHNQETFLSHFHNAENWYEEDKVLASFTNRDVDAFNKLIRNKYWNDRDLNNPPTLLRGDKIIFNSAYSINDITKFHNSEVVTIKDAKKDVFKPLGIEYWTCKATESADEEEFRVIDPESQAIFNKKLSEIAKQAKKEKNKEEKKKLWEVFFKTRETFADVKYIYASTIHKLQGSTHEKVYIDLYSLSNMKSLDYDTIYRLMYVAISRASDDIVILIPSFKDQTINELEGMFGSLSVGFYGN
jgi:ATP-dependent exoDNAse (exonuclease V) alpha subunit